MKTFICGHRNPDVDTVMSAYALADLRQRLGTTDVEALVAGKIPEKACWVFDHFKLTPPCVRRDVYVRVRDLIDSAVPTIDASMPLINALRALEESGESSLPVKDAFGHFVGMLSPVKLLPLFLAKSDLTLPVGEAPLRTDTHTLIESDRVHDVRAAAISDAHNHFPVIDDSGHLLGTVLKRAFAQEPPYRMILVDHNETEQGIPGLEEIPVIEVVDHHRISFAATREPIRYTADVVGSTCTLVAQMFRAAGLRPTREIAGVLIAGIVADTLLFQSPTTTPLDRQMANWLEKICGESCATLMTGLMSVASPLTSLTPDQAIAADAKTYTESGRRFVLAQIEETGFGLFHQMLGPLKDALQRATTAQGLDFMALMVTDAGSGNSELLFNGSETVRRALPYRRGSAGVLLMPGVMSRKKQLLPTILSALA